LRAVSLHPLLDRWVPVLLYPIPLSHPQNEPLRMDHPSSGWQTGALDRLRLAHAQDSRMVAACHIRKVYGSGLGESSNFLPYLALNALGVASRSQRSASSVRSTARLQTGQCRRQKKPQGLLGRCITSTGSLHISQGAVTCRDCMHSGPDIVVARVVVPESAVVPGNFETM
jgi:hypothetical protein